MSQDIDHGVGADRDRVVGMLVALAVVVIVAAALIAIFGVPARQDCTYERHGKGSFTARCVQQVA
jgi:hypothetical protein